MEYQEREQLNRFLQQLTQAQAGQKDNEAEQLIRAACARQPDAAYLLVQRALLLEQAVNDAHATINRLQSELITTQQANQPANRGFLADTNSWGQKPVAARPAPAAPSAYPGNLPPPAAAPAASSWGSSFLGNVAATAAGVAAGSFLYHGISNLMSDHHTQSLSSAQPSPAHTEQLAQSNYDSSFDSSGSLDDLGPGDDWS